MRNASQSQPLGFRDLLVAIFLIVLIPLTGWVATSRAREQSNRIKCASNLRQIGQAIQIYANENKGGFPRTLWTPDASPVPTEYTGANAPEPFLSPFRPDPSDVTAAMYLLLRTMDITSDAFVCPSGVSQMDVTPFDPGPSADYAAFSNFASRANLSYGYTNPYPSSTARALGFKLNYTLSSDFAIAADMSRGPEVTKVASTAQRKDMVTANSPNHAGDGQNVLYADGHVDWSPTIFCGSPRPTQGAPRDNVYAFGVDTSQSAPSAGTHGAPLDQYDSVILPTADLGAQPGMIAPPGGRTNWTLIIGLVVGGVIVLGGAAVLLVILMKAGKKSAAMQHAMAMPPGQYPGQFPGQYPGQMPPPGPPYQGPPPQQYR